MSQRANDAGSEVTQRHIARFRRAPCEMVDQRTWATKRIEAKFAGKSLRKQVNYRRFRQIWRGKCFGIALDAQSAHSLQNARSWANARATIC